MNKAKEILNMFVTEGLVDGDMMPQSLPKLDPNIQQSRATANAPSKLEVPQDEKQNPVGNKPDLPNELKKKDSDKDEKEDIKSDYKEALEASHHCLSLAEHHLSKLNKMKEIEEGEDINLDKIGAAHKIITDTKQALQEMLKKIDQKKTEPIKEDVETKEPSLEDILKNPSKFINQKPSQSDFVQAGAKRISLINEKYSKSKNMILFYPRTSFMATINNEAKDLQPIFSLNGVYYYIDGKKVNVYILKPFERQATAQSIAGDLLKPDRFDNGKERLEKLV